MVEQEKDLTGIIELSESLEASGQAPPPPEGSVMEEVPIEAIDSFESLSDFATANPTPEPSVDPSLELSNETPPATERSNEGLSGGLNENFNQGFDFSETPPEVSNQPLSDLSPQTPPPASPPPESHLDIPPVSQPPQSQHLKSLEEERLLSKSIVPAELPFSLLITGELKDEEKEKLISLLERHKMGIDESDIQIQLKNGRILIPRISEYAGVLLVQGLRGIQAEIQLGLTDSFTQSSDDQPKLKSPAFMSAEFADSNETDSLPADLIPVTSESSLPQLPNFSVIDTLIVSATLKSRVLEMEKSTEYTETLEALKRELKHKASRKGAAGVLNLKIQIQPLHSPTAYRITVIGTAVKSADHAAEIAPKNPPHEFN